MPLEAADLRPILAELRVIKQAVMRNGQEQAETRGELATIKQHLRPTRGVARVRTFMGPGYGDTSERTVYRWGEEGRVRLIRIGGTVYVDLDHWFDQIERLRAEQTQNAAQSGPPPDDKNPELQTPVA